jgi:uncharacterized membrane protein HdeD (DUF308 family)
MSQTAPIEAPSQQLPRLRNGLGTSSLVIGILALVLAVLVAFAPLAVILGAVAVGLGIAGIARANRGVASNRSQAVAGLITGGIGLVLSIAMLVTIGIYLNRHSTEFRDFRDCVDRANSVATREACVDQLSQRLNY